jgi:hypothetical protein
MLDRSTVPATPRPRRALGALAAGALGLRHAMDAQRWLERSREPDWPAVHAAWHAALPDPGAIDPALGGEFQPQDRWQLVTGATESAALRAAMRTTARTSVDLAVAHLQSGEAGLRTARGLADCARRGVRVRLIADERATARQAAERPGVQDVVAGLRAEGVQVKLFQCAARPFDAWQRRLLLIDGRALLLGGGEEALPGGTGTRDPELLLLGPTVAAARPWFEAMWDDASAPPLPGDVARVFHAPEPARLATHPSFLFLLQCVRACRRTLDIETARYLPHPPVLQALREARARGARVRLLTTPGRSLVASGLAQMMEAGVDVYVRRSRGPALQGSYFVADREWVGFGGTDLGWFAPRFGLGLGLHVQDERLARELGAWFEEGIDEAAHPRDPAVLHAAARRGFPGKVLDRWQPFLP